MNKELNTLQDGGNIERKIWLIRGQKVMVDSDLAELYEVDTKYLNRAVKRNINRFPQDFCFRLTKDEQNLILQSAISSLNRSQIATGSNLKCQFGTSSLRHGGKRKLSYAFTEHGVAMLSSVLRSERAVQMNIFIIRAFVKIREMLATHKDLAHKLDELERKQNETSTQLASVYSVVKQLINPPPKDKKPIGFETLEEGLQ
jgi:hypothetical protein